MKQKLFALLLALWTGAWLLPVPVSGETVVDVRFQVIGGLWSNGTSEQTRSFAAGHVLSEEDIPWDMSPKTGYGGGSWVEDPLGTTVNEGTAFRFIFQKLISVTFDGNGGGWNDGAAQTETQVFAGAVCERWPEPPVRPGFAFWGWSLLPYGEAFDEHTAIHKDTTLYAQWRENRTLSFDENGGQWPQGAAPEADVPGGLVEAHLFPEVPRREGYAFHHWNTQPDGLGQVLEPGSVLQAHTTAYAQWRRIFILHLYENTGESPEILEHIAEEQGILTHSFPLPAPSRTGHTFLGWNTRLDGSGEEAAAGSLYTVDEANNPAALYAQWQRCSYQVSFEGIGEVRTCLWGDALGTLPEPGDPPENCRFGGWCTAGGQALGADTPVTDHLTLHPLWIPQARVTFQILGGIWQETGDDTYSCTLDQGEPLTQHLPTALPAPEYKAPGTWDVRPGNAADGALFTYACQERKRFSLVFDTEDLPIEVLEGHCPRLPSPTKPGHRFDGWYTAKTGGTQVDETTVIERPLSLFARWTPICTLTYHPNGGGQAPQPEVLPGTGGTLTFTVSHQVPERSGHSFQGWARTPDAREAEFHGGDPCQTQEDLTLYALWKRDIQYVTLTFLDRDTETARLTLESGQQPGTAMPQDPVRAGFRFLGWNTRPDGGGSVLTPETPVLASAAVYACWEPVPEVEVSFLDRGREVDWFTLDAGGTVGDQLPPPPIREGFVFLGWQTADGALFTNGTPVETDLQVHALWKKITRGTVVFMNESEEFSRLTLDLGASFGVHLPPAPERPGFRFLGWNTREDGTGKKLYKSTTIREDFTAWAQWQEIHYVTLTFHDRFHGSTTITLEENTASGPQFPENPTHRGYTFRGWYTQDNSRKVTKTTKIQEDTHLYAAWRQKSTTNARTGDAAPIRLCLTLLAASALALTAVFIKKRR